VDNVQEELRTTAVGLTRVGHGEGARLVGVLGAVGLTELVRDAALTITRDLTLAGNIVLGVGRRASSTSSLTLGVLGVGAAELIHEVRNNTVEVKTSVKPGLAKINEVPGSDRHIAGINFDGEASGGGVESYGLVGHFE